MSATKQQHRPRKDLDLGRLCTLTTTAATTMTYIGLSILIASVSFFCYKHPPKSWPLSDWLRRCSKTRDGFSAIRHPPDAILKDGRGQHRSHEEENGAEGLKVELDGKFLPPPLLLTETTPSEPDSPTTPRASAIPSFALDGQPTMPPPLVPAFTSPQGASSRRAPPTLAPIPASLPSFRSNNGTTNQAPASSLMPPPARGPLPNRLPASTLLAPTSKVSNTRSKAVHLSPGHSPLDWARLLSSTSAADQAHLRGLPASAPYLKVPPSQLAYHNGRKDSSTGKKKDAWTALGGKVYNITAYLDFHPGGKGELMRCAGKDGTSLFREVHSWVSWEGMLEPGCLIGWCCGEGEGSSQREEATMGRWEEMD